MAKKKVIIIPWEDTAKWLCTFNDLMTLLLTFFVLILSMSSLNASKVKDLQAQLIDALGVMEFGKSEGQPIIDQMFDLKDMGKKYKILKSMQTRKKENKQIRDYVEAEIPPELQLKEFVMLKQEGKKEFNEENVIFRQFEKLIDENYFEPGISIIKRKRGVVLRLKDKILFSQGDAQIRKAAFNTLNKISPILRKTSLNVSIEGHTDSTPIRSGKYPSNWDLSMARALSVLDFFMNRSFIDPDKLSVAGLADSLPIKKEDSSENRAMNRRIELVFSSY